MYASHLASCCLSEVCLGTRRIWCYIQLFIMIDWPHIIGLCSCWKGILSHLPLCILLATFWPLYQHAFYMDRGRRWAKLYFLSPLDNSLRIMCMNHEDKENGCPYKSYCNGCLSDDDGYDAVFSLLSGQCSYETLANCSHYSTSICCIGMVHLKLHSIRTRYNFSLLLQMWWGIRGLINISIAINWAISWLFPVWMSISRPAHQN